MWGAGAKSKAKAKGKARAKSGGRLGTRGLHSSGEHHNNSWCISWRSRRANPLRAKTHKQKTETTWDNTDFRLDTKNIMKFNHRNTHTHTN